jgi:hypothetical protein
VHQMVIVAESGSLDDGRHLNLIPPAASSDAHVDEIEEHVDEIEELRRALMSSLIEVGDTEVTSLKDVLESRNDG